jgi:glycerol-1-phosphatase
MSLTRFLSAYDHVLLDLDGCVWVGDEPTPRVVEAIDAIRAAGLGIAFVTNNAMHPAEEFVRKLWGLGCRASVEEVVTSGGATQDILERGTWQRAFTIGAPALHRNVEQAGLTDLYEPEEAMEAEVVVVAAHEDFCFAELRTAAIAIQRGAEIVATDADASYPIPDGQCPGTGSVLAALERATGRTALIAGKPSPEIFRVALSRLGPGRALVIGDRIDADLAGAHAAGLDGAVVLSGVTTAGEAASAGAVNVADTLADLVLGPDRS